MYVLFKTLLIVLALVTQVSVCRLIVVQKNTVALLQMCGMGFVFGSFYGFVITH